jgi:uncharacterized SAM-binding protein YcdF (DUF218 family)
MNGRGIEIASPDVRQAPNREKRLGGLFTRKPRWGLSARGWALGVALVIIGSALFAITIYPFLAVTKRVDTDVLVVEGWLQNDAMRAAAAEFRAGGYVRVFTTGGPVAGMSGYTNDFNTAASVGAGNLEAAGIPKDKITIAPSRIFERDRTYGSAVALREWFHTHNLHPGAINVVTEGPHARRTRLLFQRAFGAEATVGIIAIPNPDYNPRRWWQYSEGVKDVITESVAYLYAKLIFWRR